MTRYLIQKTADSPVADSVVHSLVRMELYIRHNLQQEKRQASRQMGYIHGLWQTYTSGPSTALHACVRGMLGKPYMPLQLCLSQ